ncbi:MAG: hypothetical protein WB762_14125 [Candidatus Sulfotelmatobacter sp.]
MLTRGSALRRVALSAALLSALAPAAVAQVFAGTFTQHNNLGRTGQNLNETLLTTSNVRSTTFNKLFPYPVDNQVYGQPLYVPNVSIPGQGASSVATIPQQAYVQVSDNAVGGALMLELVGTGTGK